MFSQGNVVANNRCLACGSDKLELTLDLGDQPLANSYKGSKTEIQDKFPLAINRCKNCFHLQLTHDVNPVVMFQNYLYVSGTSKTYRDYMEWYAGWTAGVFSMFNFRTVDSVLDIGCNDGTQLNYYKRKGIRTVGVDPAENLYPLSSVNHTVYQEFFNQKFAESLGEYFDIVTMQNAFAHQYNPLETLRAISKLMHTESLLFLSTSQAEMVVNNEFDTIYHEHVNFFNINSMYQLVKRAGLYLLNVYKTPIHGTSYVFVIGKSSKHFNQSTVNYLIETERQQGLLTDDTYIKYRDRCMQLRDELVNTVNAYRLEHNCKVVGYGAAAKGMTLLNFTGLELDFIVDDSPLKQGLYTPGSSIPIVSIDILDTIKEPVLFIPLAWNFYNEIVSRIKLKRNISTDRFCRYFPSVEIKN